MPPDVGPILDLQQHDSASDHLRARRRELPELGEAQRLAQELRRGEAALSQAAQAATEARREQEKLEAELGTLEAKAAGVADRLYGRAGVVSSPKELQALQADLEMLNRQKEPLEERVIVAMDARDQATELEKRTEAALAEIRARLDAAEAARAKAESEIDAELAGEEDRRASLRSQVPAALLNLYDRLRTQFDDGVAAAPLQAGICGGCKLRLSNAEYEAARHASDVVRCEACRRILVIV